MTLLTMLAKFRRYKLSVEQIPERWLYSFICLQKNLYLHKYAFMITMYLSRLKCFMFSQTVDEKCIYMKHPEKNGTTLCSRQAWINSHVYGFSGILSAFGMNRFKKNVGQTVVGFEYVLNKLYMPEANIENKIAVGSMKEKAKEYAKSKADTMKSKVTPQRTAACET